MALSLDALITQHDEVEAAAYRDMFAAAPAAMVQALGLQTRELAGATLLLAPGAPTPVLNRVIGLGNSLPADDALLDEIISIYHKAGIKDWWLHLSPTSGNSALVTQLSAHGFIAAERRSWAKMQRGHSLPAPVASEARIDVVATGEENALAEAICTAFDMPTAMAPWFAALAGRPGWHAVSAKLNDRIVGGGYLHVQDQLGWLGIGGVHPDARRMHIHQALMVQRIQLAIAANCLRLFTETGEAIGDEPNPSLQNMYSCGFDLGFSRMNYILQPGSAGV